jgi:hypothetical protein
MIVTTLKIWEHSIVVAAGNGQAYRVAELMRKAAATTLENKPCGGLE